MPGPGQVYRHPSGGLALYVRTEERHAGTEHLFAYVRNRMVYSSWYADTPSERELINDTAGRSEAVIAWAEVKALEAQRDVLVRVMGIACSMVPDRAANELRDLYTDGMKDVEMISV